MSLTPRADKLEQAVYSNEIEVSKIDAPFTTIVNEQGNPRQIPDLANNMKTSMGIERISFKKLYQQSKEFGPTGGRVYSIGDERVRLIGNDWHLFADTNGTRTYTNASTNTDHKIEVTFYGTGLNLLLYLGTSRPFNISIDGNVVPPITYEVSNRLIGRLYDSNSVVNVVSGLSLGIHTITLSQTGVDGWMDIFGVEIVNESTQLVTNPGKPKLDLNESREILTQTLSSYNSDFDDSSDILGSKGGRVLVYQNIDGEIKKRLTATDPAVTIGNPAELVTNGTFDVDTTGWVGSNGGVLSVDSQRLKLTNSAALFGGADQVLSGLIIGQSYSLTFDYIKGTASQIHVRIYNSAVTVYPYAAGWFSVSGTYQLDFTALETTHVVRLFQVNVSGQTSFFDNVSVKETAYNHLALLNSDHSNEEIIRKINLREFGKQRGDDFSTLSTGISDRAFTLDDGTTTLVGNDVSVSSEVFGGGSVFYLTLTFIGTGLDVIGSKQSAEDQAPIGLVIVDGINVGSWLRTGKKQKICSGLPYGTHTVKFTNGGVGPFGGVFSDFIIYGPKKPELESIDIELADYNLMADFNSSNQIGTADEDNYISQGVLLKNAMREFIYNGPGYAWGTSSPLTLSYFYPYSNSNGASFKYTFWGTGCVLHNQASSIGVNSFDIEIDGVLNTSGVALSNASNNGAGNYSSTIVSSYNPVRIEFTGLPLALHTIEVTKTAGSNMAAQAIQVITPIHINNNKIGSLGLKDLRNAIDVSEEVSKNKVDMNKVKGWLQYNEVTKEILNSYNVSAVISGGTGRIYVYWKNAFKDEKYVVVNTANHVDSATQVNAFTKNRVLCSQFLSDTNVYVIGIFNVVAFGELENEEDIDLGDL